MCSFSKYLTSTRFIEEEDLMRFMIKEEVDYVFPLFEGSETGRIDRKSLTDWVVRPFSFMCLDFHIELHFLVRFWIY